MIYFFHGIIFKYYISHAAAMVELVDTLVLGTSAFGRGGSTPSRGTFFLAQLVKHFILLFPSHLSQKLF